MLSTHGCGSDTLGITGTGTATGCDFLLKVWNEMDAILEVYDPSQCSESKKVALQFVTVVKHVKRLLKTKSKPRPRSRPGPKPRPATIWLY